MASTPRSLRRTGDGDVDWRSVLTAQREVGTPAAACTGGIAYLRRTTTPRKGRNPDPLIANIEDWDSPRRLTLINRPTTAPAAKVPSPPVASLANHLSATELDFHLTRVTELLRRAPDPAALPEECKRKIRQIAAYEAFVKESSV